MSIRRAAPGVQVSQGRLRVDAARAIKKLREYQLVDRAAWVLEGIRAAVAASATKISLRGDSNDIWLAWQGTPWEPELLPRLFDELVSPEVSDEKQHVRLLAAAVNSALGMNPQYVDVYSITAAGVANRARYTPEVLAEPENDLGEAPLRHVAVEQHEPPTDITSGILVHLRRRTSLQLISYLLGEPPELPLARKACADLPIPLELDKGVTLHRETHRDLVRLPLEEGLDGFIAITRDNVDPKSCFWVAERGVVLARSELQLLGFNANVPLPIRVYLSADRLPTNASRSQVRSDVHPITTAAQRAKQLVEAAVQKLIGLYGDGLQPTSADARKAGLSLLASAIAGHPVGWKHQPSLLAPLAKLPLARNSLGKPRTVDAAWTTYIYTEKAPLDADLEQWIDEVLWAPPGDDIRILLADYHIDVSEARRHARWARQQRRAHQKFLAHRKREIKVQTSVHPRVRASVGVMVERSCVPQETFEGVAGEVCIFSESRNASVVLCVDGRELERVEFVSAIPFDAVIDSKKLTPGERYRGVLRDGNYAVVDRALRAGVVRAIELLVAEGKVIEADMPLIRSALALARDMGLSIAGPLAQTPVFRKLGGGYLTYNELVVEKFIGVIAETESFVPPPGRVIVHANGEDREYLRKLFPSRVISYHKAVQAKGIDLGRIAHQMPRSGRSACLIVKKETASGVITLSTKPTLYVHHAGVRLAERTYKHSLVKSDIAVVSDAVVPNDKWTGMVDEAGLSQWSFRDFEILLLRAIASRLTDQYVEGLLAPDVVNVEDVNFTALMDVLLAHDPKEILGTELYDRVCDHKMFQRLGSYEKVSIRQLADDNPQGIFYIDTTDAPPLADFAPVFASMRLASLIGRLGRRNVFDGKPELKRRQKVHLHKERLDALLANSPQAVGLPGGGPSVSFVGKCVRGVVGVSESVPEIRIFTEGRLFKTVTIALGYPLAADVELELSKCGDTLDGPSNLTIEEIADDLRNAVPALLLMLAKTIPDTLGEPGAARRLLAQFLAGGTVSADLRFELRAMKAFVTVQGGELRSISELENPPAYLPIAAFSDEWLTPGDGEFPTPHDGPILRVIRPPDELDGILDALHDGPLTDLSKDVARLQARRRMARGLLPTPKLLGTPANLRRPLKDFPDFVRRLGHGEVGFSSTSLSTLLIHEQGQLQRTMDIDVMPAIDLAIEAPHEVLDHGQMVRLAQDLAVELVRTALPAELGVTLRRNLCRAVLSRRVPPAAIGAAPLFQLVDGSWISWPTFQAQLDKYLDVWAVTATLGNPRPLDPERLVLYLDAADIELAKKSGYHITNAKIELELDEKTRTNQARDEADNLDLPTPDGRILGVVELEGNGTTGPRGIVAALLPQFSSERGVYAHKAMHPFDRQDDVCRWPTVTMVDDARITPDRTWSFPKGDETWTAIMRDIRAASEKALEQYGVVPGHALAEIRVTSHVCSDVKAIREAPRSLIRGVMWLTALPYTPVPVEYRHYGGLRSFVPAHGLAVGGQLAVYAEPISDLDINEALEQLAGVCHGKLVRMMLKNEDLDSDTVAAHVAHAIALNTVKPTEIKDVEFGCFAPKPFEPRQLASLFRRTDEVPTVKAGVTDIAEPAFVDDGSELAKVVKAHLGDRLIRRAPPPKPKPSPPPPTVKPPVSVERPAMQIPVAPIEKVVEKPAKPKPPPKPHVLQPLVDALIARVGKLGIQTFGWDIIDTNEPMVQHDQSRVMIGGKNARLKAIAAELAADSIHAGPALDALAAHVVSVLNIARSDITDASEMHALGVLLATQPSATPPRSRRSS